MITKTLENELYRLEVCRKSGGVFPGQTFARADLPDLPCGALPDGAVTCVGRISENETVFSAGNGRYFFSVLDGWGAENGTLYGLRAGFSIDLGRPHEARELLAECERPLVYRSFAGAMAARGRKETLEKIRAAFAGAKE